MYGPRFGANYEQRDKEAFSLIHSAVEQYELGVCYERGYGTERDLWEAIRWYLATAKQNYPPAMEAVTRLKKQDLLK
jgi:TPR repeat protein